MNPAIARTVAIVSVVLAAGCSQSTPNPAAPTKTQVPVAAVPVSKFPPLTGPSQTFVFSRPASYAVSDYTQTSRFVLYDTGGFELQYPSIGTGAYRGGYHRTGDDLVFEWEGWSVAGPWGATGTLKDGVLTVKYNIIMQLSDFDDAVYVLVR